MYASEDMFPHLRQAAEERLLRELEYRRRAIEDAETATTGARGLRLRTRRFRRLLHLSPRQISHV
ncbi:hypothetical protein ACH3VR_01750 [Microbacterium sp. B2969]|uniref:Uncharacterized protein n=1 Tax=Microbacterium alkaliflavum TaxID=3248839 RepID=A0ABW7Q334_9MICO